MEKRYSFPITGMYCVNCARGVERKVRALASVKAAEVNPATQILYVVMQAGKDQVMKVVEAIREAGFDVLASELRIHIAGFRNASIAAEIEKVLFSIEGVLDVESLPASEEALIEYIPGQIGPYGIARKIRDAGFIPSLGDGGEIATSFEAEVDARTREYYGERRKFWFGLAFTIPLVFLSIGRTGGAFGAWSHDLWINLLLWALATPVVFYTGSDYFKRGWQSLHDQSSNLDVLVLLGVSVAYFYSIFVVLFPRPGSYLFFDIAAVVVVLVKLGKLLEARLRGKSGVTLLRLKDLAPKRALCLRNGKEEIVPVSEIFPGDLLVLEAGSYVPADGMVVDGNGSLDESSLTGESLPVDKKVGDRVLAGTLNNFGKLVFRAEKVGNETMLASIIRMVRGAQGSRPAVQTLVDETSAIFVPVVIIVAIFICLLWIFITGNFTEAIIRLIAVLVVACPAALGLAAPTAIMAATGRAAEQGILFKTGRSLEDAAMVDMVVFNKTGSITYGRPELMETISFDKEFSEDELLAYAAATEGGSAHPLGKALSDRAKELGLTLPETENFVLVGGFGVKAVCGGHSVLLGRPRWIANEGVEKDWVDGDISRLRGEGKIVLCLAVGGVLKGLFALADRPRPEMPSVIARIKAMNILPVLITGDNRESAEATASFCGIDEVFFDVRPEEKVATVRKFQDSGKKVAVVGDGVNDAPALAVANLGITMGPGTDLALETGDVILTMGKTEQVPLVFAIGRASMRVIRKNLFWSLCYNVTLIPIAGGILAPISGMPEMLRHMNPMLGALAMVLGSLSVLWHSLRLYRSEDLVRREEEGGVPLMRPRGDLTRWGSETKNKAPGAE